MYSKTRLLIIAALSAVLMSGCASNPDKTNQVGTNDSQQIKKYKIGAMKIALESLESKKYPNQDGINAIFKESLSKKLAERGLLATSDSLDFYEINVNGNYKRIFFGEAFGATKVFGASNFSYRSEVKHKETIQASFSKDDLIYVGSMPFNRFSKPLRTITFLAGPSDELKEIDSYVTAIVDDLTSVKK